MTENLEKRHLGVFEKDFGNTEAEEIGKQFLRQHFNSFKEVEHASKYDDLRGGVDFVARLTNDKQLAIQFTVTDSLEKRVKKIEKILQNPIVHLHDDEGNVISADKIPVVMLYEEKKKLADAWAAGAFEKLEETKAKFLDQMIDCLSILSENKPEYKSYFNPILEILRNEQKEMLNKSRTLPEGKAA